ncbi:uncharacterized protein N7459_007408 [Penicillium hispanicum]|uniref:uncharacterized protein n=1 Tax=Penicillium hispanicum TaxID=1080232 RepID=UPI0025408540|nr:uncharacterized protein N7459_007408 [Penicillium hispanicum]KAJ5578444.1 hypothetical protein N7459_007408 [Penicillium hispanicum]
MTSVSTFPPAQMAVDSTPGLKRIDFARGWPNPAHIPADHLLRSAQCVLENPAVANPGLLYGPDEGSAPLRRNIAEWLGEYYQVREAISPQRICITGGASQNLASVLQVFTDPVYTRNVWMVEPTYHLAERIMDDAGFAGRIYGVPEDDEGIDLDFLESGLRQAEDKAELEKNTHPPARPWRKIYKHVIYAVPSFSNPSGKMMSLGHREQLVRLARKYDALLVTDDVYDFLQWPADVERPLEDHFHAFQPRLVDIDRYLDGGPADEWGHAISNGSFSKLIGPGTRCGWAEATIKVAYGLSQVGQSRSGGAPSQFTSTIINQCFENHFLQDHVNVLLRDLLGESYRTMRSHIEQKLIPRGVTTPRPSPANVAGGYFTWITLPAPLRAAEIVKRAQEDENLYLAPGDIFRVAGDPHGAQDRFSNCLRLCYAWEDVSEISEGIERLARVLDRAKADL